MTSHPIVLLVLLVWCLDTDQWRTIWRDWRAQRARRLPRPDKPGWTKPQLTVLYSSIALSLLFFHLSHQ